MYLNEFADGLETRDMSRSQEFASLLASASDLGIPHEPAVRYASAHTIVRHQRFHYLEWGDRDRPPVLLLHGGNQSAHSWDLVSLHLADRYRVVAVDQRGHGDSEWRRESDYFPVLVVRGAQSPVLEPDAARRFASALPDGRLITVPDCGHNVHSQNTPGFLAGIAPLLASLG